MHHFGTDAQAARRGVIVARNENLRSMSPRTGATDPKTDITYEVTANLFRQVPAYSANRVLATYEEMDNLHFWLQFFCL